LAAAGPCTQRLQILSGPQWLIRGGWRLRLGLEVGDFKTKMFVVRSIPFSIQTLPWHVMLYQKRSHLLRSWLERAVSPLTPPAFNGVHLSESPMGLWTSYADLSLHQRGIKVKKSAKIYRNVQEMIPHRSDLADIDAELVGKIQGIRLRCRSGQIPAKTGLNEAPWGWNFYSPSMIIFLPTEIFSPRSLRSPASMECPRARRSFVS